MASCDACVDLLLGINHSSLQIPFEAKAGMDPASIRKILSSEDGSYFATNDVPLMPFLNGRVGRITSLASVTHQTVSAVCIFCLLFCLVGSTLKKGDI